MIATWLGQAGWMLQACGKTILVDPYLSDSVEKQNPHCCRRVEIRQDFLKIQPDILICTHNHLDHTDPETLKHYLCGEKAVTVLASKNAWRCIRRQDGNNYVLFNRHTQWSDGRLQFFAVAAAHSDESAIGVLIHAEDKLVYITGDTLFNTDVLADLPSPPDVIMLPVNGAGNNMNLQDAHLFAEATGAKRVIPMHYGMYDDITPQDIRNESSDWLLPGVYEPFLL